MAVEGGQGAAYSPSHRDTNPLENTMNAITLTTRSAAQQPLLAASSRLTAAIAVATLVSLVSLGASAASHQAVRNTAVMLSAAPVALPTVEVIGHRDAVVARTIRAGKAA
jgi:hypothetical protein